MITYRFLVYAGAGLLLAVFLMVLAYATGVLEKESHTTLIMVRTAAVVMASGLLLYAVVLRRASGAFGIGSLLLHAGLAVLVIAGTVQWGAKRTAHLVLAQGEAGALPEWAGGAIITPRRIEVVEDALGGVSRMSAEIVTADGRGGITEVNRPLEIENGRTGQARVYLTEAGPTVRLAISTDARNTEFTAKHYPGEDDRFEIEGYEPLVIRSQGGDNLMLRYGDRPAVPLRVGERTRWDSTVIEAKERGWWVKMLVTNSGGERLILAGFGIAALGLLLELPAAVAGMRRRTGAPGTGSPGTGMPGSGSER